MPKLVKQWDKFANVPNTILRDRSMSLREKGLYAVICDFQDGFVFNLPILIEKSKEGRDATTKAYRRLFELGYLSKRPIRLPNGRMGGYDVVINERPIPEKPKKPRKKTETRDSSTSVSTALLKTPNAVGTQRLCNTIDETNPHPPSDNGGDVATPPPAPPQCDSDQALDQEGKAQRILDAYLPKKVRSNSEGYKVLRVIRQKIRKHGFTRVYEGTLEYSNSWKIWRDDVKHYAKRPYDFFSKEVYDNVEEYAKNEVEGVQRPSGTPTDQAKARQEARQKAHTKWTKAAQAVYDQGLTIEETNASLDKLQEMAVLEYKNRPDYEKIAFDAIGNVCRKNIQK